MKIGVVAYLNAFPLYYALENNSHIELVKDIPSRLAALLKAGELDAGLISSIEYYREKERLNILPGLGIFAQGAVDSIRLFFPGGAEPQAKEHGDTRGFAKERPGDFIQGLGEQALAADKKITIYYDQATRSSLEMTKILFFKTMGANFFKNNLICIEKQPPHRERIENLAPHEFLLLIGDQALQHKEAPSVDIGSWYWSQFQMPAIFAVWAYPKKMGADKKEMLQKIILAAPEEFEASAMIGEAVKRFGFSLEFTQKYLSETIRYKMGAREEKALAFFFQEYEKMKSC